MYGHFALLNLLLLKPFALAGRINYKPGIVFVVFYTFSPIGAGRFNTHPKHYGDLLLLWRSMSLTEMYEHNVQQNEGPRCTFFIITHNDYGLNLRKKMCVNLYLHAVVPAVLMKV